MAIFRVTKKLNNICISPGCSKDSLTTDISEEEN